MRAILFDFDGTIMDTEPAIIASYFHVFEVYRKREDFTPERQVEVLGPSLETEMLKFFPEMDPQVCIQEYRNYQNEYIQNLVQPMAHAMELLEWIKDQGYPAGVISTRLSDSLKHILGFTHMDQYVQITVGHDDVVNDKPDPEGINLAMKELGCTSSIYVGDSTTDILAGKNAGSYTVAAMTKPEKEAALKASNPDVCIYDLLELKQILKKLEGE